MRILLLTGALVAALALTASGCGSDGSPAAASVPFDQAFIDAMVPHHEQAIEMAKSARAAGLSEPVLVDIADAIIATQQDEIETMKGWRADWYGSAEIDRTAPRSSG
jgi:uncharacterized protein (DUF305 family)